MSAQLADTVAMVAAPAFGSNPETQASNAFQQAGTERDAARLAAGEQDMLAANLERAGVRVLRLAGQSGSPDALFPNNWFSTHADGTLVLYPMLAPSRRRERLADLRQQLAQAGYETRRVIDYSHHEREQRFLEGTGSLVLDRERRIAFANASPRTDELLARQWAEEFDYELCFFEARDPEGNPLYHTNVIMSLGPGVSIACLEVIDENDRARVRERLEARGELIEIGWTQVCAFAGNQLFLAGPEGPVLALSARAAQSLDADQKARLDRHARRVVTDIAVIERHGGGSVRCMLAEIFLPRSTRSEA